MIILENQRTPYQKDQEIKKRWSLVDAKDQVLGRMASKVAHLLRGKHRVDFSTHQDIGDFVVVINARHIRTTGRKLEKKVYRVHSGYPGGLKTVTLKKKMEKHPTFAVEAAVKRMLPSGPLGRKLLKNLKVYPDAEHKNQAQKPSLVAI